MIIPSNRKWSQTNAGELFGILHASKNMNFVKEGYAQLSKRPVASIYNTTSFETMVSCHYIKGSSNSGYYAMTAGKPFRFNLDGSAPTDLTGATNGGGITGSIQFDGVPWQGRWYISQSTSFSYYTLSTNTFTNSLGSLSSPDTASAGHPLCVWENFNYLCIGDHNTVKVYDTSHALITTITLPSNFEVRWIRYNHQRIFIGTKNLTGGDAVMFVADDATASSATDAWPVPANWLFSGITYKSSIVVVTSRGQVLRFGGGGWEEMGAFPVYYSNYSWYQGSGYVNGRVEQRGMATDGSIIYINIDGYVGDNNIYLDNQPSGLWTLDPSVSGLTHKGGITLDKYQTISITVGSTNTTTDVFTAGSTFTAQTGVKVWYKVTGTNPAGGLKKFSYYYLIRVSSSTFKLASSYANAIAGTQIDITSAGDANQTLHYCDELDAGGSIDDGFEPGAVCMVTEIDSNPISSATGFGYMTGSEVLYGAANVTTTDGSTTVDMVLSFSVGYNRGYIVIQKIFSSQLKDAFKSIIVKCTRLFQTSDKAVIKARFIDKAYYPLFNMNGDTGQAIWVSSTSFTTVLDLTNVVVGEEIEFTAGRGNGLTAHIVSTTNNAGTWTVVIDETIPGVSASDKSGFAIQNFKKIGSLISTDLDSLFDKKIADGNIKKWIQIKVELRGHSEPTVEELQLISSINTPSK